MTLRAPLLTCACACAALGLGACGSSSSNSNSTASTPSAPAATSVPATTPPAGTAAGPTRLALAADPSGMLAFMPTSLAAKAGKVTIDFANQAPVPHDVVVAKGSSVLGSTPIFNGGTKSLTLTLAKGTYTFYCSVPGHRQAGMQGTLTVS